MTQYVYKFKQGESEVMFSSLPKILKYVKNVVMPRETDDKWITVCMKDECMGQKELCQDETHIDESMKNSWLIMYTYGKYGDSDLDIDIQKFIVH